VRQRSAFVKVKGSGRGAYQKLFFLIFSSGRGVLGLIKAKN
jgi:hypothetical protein